MKAGKSKELTDGFVKELIEYTEYHFAEEEKLMEEINYDDLPLQRGAHTIFISQLKGFQERIEKGEAFLVPIELSQTVVDWLLDHIAKMDKRYEETMKRHGIQ
jgi:hemerythrin-like metal-binding protein